MSIRKKTLLTITIASMLFFALFMLISFRLILNGFNKVEENQLKENVLRVNDALQIRIDEIATKLSDWAQWDDTYQFVQNKNKTFISSNLTDESFPALKINLIAILDAKGNVVLSKFVNLQTGQQEAMPSALKPYLEKGSLLTNLPKTDSVIKGIINLPGDEMLIASRPIVTSSGAGPIRGTIIFGRYFDKTIKASLSDTTHLALTFNEANPNTRTPSIRPLNDDTIQGYTLFQTINQQPALLVTVNMDRAVHKQGMQSVYSFFLFFGVLSIAFGVVTILLLDRIVISRLYILNKGVKKIGNAQDPATHISLPGNDELSQLANEINIMVDSLQKSTELIRLDEEKLKQEAQEMEKKNSTLERSEETLLKVMSDLENTKDNIEKEKVQDEIMLRSIGEGLIVTDNNGVVKILNDAAQQMLKYTAQELVGKRISEEVVMTDEAGTQITKENNMLETVLKTGTKLSQIYYFLRKDGARFPALVTSTAVKTGESIVGAISVLRDITKEKEVDKMKTEFISLASHQLRSPITAIKWFTESMLGKGKDLPPDQVEYLHSIHESNERMIDLVDSLLNISRIESGRLSVYPKSTNILEVIEDIKKELEGKLHEKQSAIVLEGKPEDSVVFTDPKLIRHVFLNLLSNSVKYSPPNTTVTISLTKNNNMVITQIQDQGYGIPEIQQNRLFQKFFRADNIKQKETEGTGLGLYLVKIILDLLNGSIWLKSAENQGSTFWVSLPISGPKPKEGEVSLS